MVFRHFQWRTGRTVTYTEGGGGLASAMACYNTKEGCGRAGEEEKKEGTEEIKGIIKKFQSRGLINFFS